MKVFKFKILHQMYRYFGVASLLLFFFWVWPSTINAAALEGLIKGANNKPKRYASISIFGPENKRTQTNENGQFFVDLPPGSYTLRIWQQPNRQEFHFQMPPSSSAQTFHVEW